MTYIFMVFIILMYFTLHNLDFSLVEPGKISLIMWFVGCFFIEFGFLDYSNIDVFTLNSLLFLLFAIFSFVLGTISEYKRTQTHKKLKKKINVLESFRMNQVLKLIFITFSLIYSFIILYDYIVIHNFSINILILKQNYWDSYYTDGYTFKNSVLALIRPFSFILAIAFPIFLKTRKLYPSLFILSFISIFCLSIEDILKGKRGVTILVLLAVFFFSILIMYLNSDRKKINFKDFVEIIGLKKTLSFIFIVFFSIYFIFGIFPALKNTDLTARTADKWLNFITPGIVVKKEVYTIEESGMVPNIGALAFGLQYLSNPIPTYTDFYENTDIKEWLLMGRYNLPQFNRVISQITNTKSAFMTKRLEIEKQSLYGKNPFKTGVTDFIIDFSTWGTILMMFLFGKYSQKLFLLVIKKKSIELMVAYSLILSAIFSFPLFSSFYMGVFTNTLLVSLFTYFFLKPLFKS